MAWIDWVILAVLVLATFGGLAQGFLRTACSLAGLVFGLALAFWNYAWLGSVFKPIVRSDAIANTIAFLLIALLVMAVAYAVGGALSRTIHKMGLGCLDVLAGAALGFVQGAGLIMICILVTVAFFPGQHWLTEAKLPKFFFGACHLSTRVSPSELGDRVREGLRMLEQESPEWMHSGHRST
jgi:membrane protein required for colicin V production